METVIIVIHLMVIIALVAVVLMQRSEGGALGIGGSGNFMSTRGQGNVLTRSTAILAVAFFATSISLTILARIGERPSSILDQVPSAGQTAPAPAGTGTAPPTSTGTGQGILDELQGLSQPPAGGAAGTSGDGAPAPAAGGSSTAPATTPPPGDASTAPPATTSPQVPTTQ
jgi:preprotein translocase subunit SecG